MGENLIPGAVLSTRNKVIPSSSPGAPRVRAATRSSSAMVAKLAMMKVLIPSGAAPGTYTVKVAYKGTLVNSPQSYSLIVTGGIPEPGIAMLATGLIALLIRFRQ